MKGVNAEYSECKKFWQYAKYHPILKQYLIKICNEGKRSPIAGKKLLDIGMRSGLPDYFLPIPNKNWYGLWLEMKRVDGRNKKKDEKQEEWIAKLIKVCYYATYTYGFDDAVRIVKDYLDDRI
jgi:hypothetical protein